MRIISFNKEIYVFVLVLSVMAFAVGGACRAQEVLELKPGGAVVVEAEQFDELNIEAEGGLFFDEETGMSRASGPVRITFRGTVITMTDVVVDDAAGVISTPNAVTLQRASDTFTGVGFEYNYREGTGSMGEACGCFLGVNVKSERLTFSSDTAVFHNAVATTCDFGSMDYSIRAESIKITSDRKVKIKKFGLFLKNRRVFKWKSYTVALGDGAPQSEPGRAVGNVSVKPASLGYNDVGGAFVRSGLKSDLAHGTPVDLNLNYYFLEGFFAQLETQRAYDKVRAWGKLGKEYKENTGYFRYLSPVPVWNLPMAGIDFGTRLVGGTRLQYNFSAEVGRLKEAHLRWPKNRAFAKLYLRYPLNPGQPVVFSLLADGRYGIYTKSLKYRVLGNGVGMDFVHGGNAKHVVRLQYMHFQPEGRTFFVSDLVDTNDKLYFSIGAKVTQKTHIGVGGEYDLDDSRFDEVEYGISRTYNCIRLDLGWRKEFNSVLFRVNVLGLEQIKQ